MPTYYPSMDLSGSRVENTFTRLVQTNNGILTDGRGNSIDNITCSNVLATASWANNAPIDVNYSSSVVSQLSTKQPILIIGNTYQITSSWAVSSSYATNGGSGGTLLITGSTYPITASFANSSSAAGLVGNINAQVTQWTDTVSNITIKYPSGVPSGVLAYATDAKSLRVGDGNLVGGTPVGVRYWNDLISPIFYDGDSKKGEIAVVNQYTAPYSSPNDYTPKLSSSMLFMNGTPGSNWVNLIEVANAVSVSYWQGQSTSPVAYIPAPAIRIDLGKNGSNASSVGGTGFGYSYIGPAITVKCGNGGNMDIVGGTVGFAGLMSTAVFIGSGDGGNAFSNGQGGIGGNCGTVNSPYYSLFIKGGSGGNASGSGAVGGNGGNPGTIILTGGNGGNATGSFQGGTGGNGGTIDISAGNGSDANGVNAGSGGGGYGGTILLRGSIGTPAHVGGNGGSFTANASGIYNGGTLNLNSDGAKSGPSLLGGNDTIISATWFTQFSASLVTGSSELPLISSDIFTYSNSARTIYSNGVMPAYGMFIAGKTLKVTAKGWVMTNGTKALTLKMYYGNNVVWQNNTPVSMSSTTGSWEFNGMLTNVYDTGSTYFMANTQANFRYDTSPSSSGFINGYNLNPSAVSHSAAIFKITAQWNGTDPNCNIRCTNATVELFN